MLSPIWLSAACQASLSLSPAVCWDSWPLNRWCIMWCLLQHHSSKASIFQPSAFFLGLTYAAAAAKSLQSCPTLCSPIDGSPAGSPVPGILQAGTLEWVAISFSNAGKWKVKVKSLSCVWLLGTPWTAALQAPPSMGFSRHEYWIGLPFPSPMQENEKWKWSHSVASDSWQPHGLQPTRLLRPWDFPGKSTGVGCHCLLHPNCITCQLLKISVNTSFYTFLCLLMLWVLLILLRRWVYFYKS